MIDGDRGRSKACEEENQLITCSIEVIIENVAPILFHATMAFHPTTAATKLIKAFHQSTDRPTDLLLPQDILKAE